MSTTSNDTTTDRIEALGRGCLDLRSVNIDWKKAAGEDGEGFQYYQAFDYSFTAADGTQHELVLVANDYRVAAVFLADGTRITLDDTEDYLAENSNDDGEALPGTLSREDLDQLTEEEPQQHGAEGPMMSHWYPIDGAERSQYGCGIGAYGAGITDEYDAAYAIRNTSMCVVEVDGAFGLALTGGGMDMTWHIVGAFIALGHLPPVNWCRDPGFADNVDRTFELRAMRRSLTVRARQLEHEAGLIDVSLATSQVPAQD